MIDQSMNNEPVDNTDSTPPPPATVVIPVYNEASNIEVFFSKLIPITQSLNMEVVAVDDGSTDSSGAVLAGIAGIKVARNPTNRGYGAALKRGIGIADGEAIIIIDADGTYRPEDIPSLFEEYINHDFDMVVGSRTGAESNIPLIRRPAKWALNKLANYLTQTKIPDLNSGLRVINKKLLDRFISILPDGFSLTTTITLAALTNGYSVKYKVIAYAKRGGKSKIRPFADTLNFVQLIFRTVLLFDPLRIFIPAGMLLLASSFAGYLYRIFMGGKGLGVTVVILFVGAIQVFAIGMLADLIDRRMN